MAIAGRLELNGGCERPQGFTAGSSTPDPNSQLYRNLDVQGKFTASPNTSPRSPALDHWEQMRHLVLLTPLAHGLSVNIAIGRQRPDAIGGNPTMVVPIAWSFES